MSDSKPERFKGRKELLSFWIYCMEHPDERFWQALRNWSGYDSIFVVEQYAADSHDTWPFESKRHDGN